MLNARPEPVVPVTDLDRAVSFYRDKVGLEVLDRYDVPPDNPMVRMRAGDGTLTVYKSVGAGQSRHTLAAFVVDDIDSAVDDLAGRGITFERYEGMPHDEKGIVRGNGPDIAWFTDPAGNILAVMQTP